MRAKEWLILRMFLAFLPAAAADLSGNLSTAWTLGNTHFASWNTLVLRLSLSELELRTFSTWQGLSLTEQIFTVSGNIGNFEIQAGVVLRPLIDPRVATWTVQDFQVVASFVSFELAFANLRFKVLFHAGPVEP